MICDFCSAANPRHEWRALHHGLTAMFDDGTLLTDDGVWLACDECNADLARGDWDALADRSVANFIVNNREEFNGRFHGSAEELREVVLTLHAAFRGEVPAGAAALEKPEMN